MITQLDRTRSENLTESLQALVDRRCATSNKPIVRVPMNSGPEDLLVPWISLQTPEARALGSLHHELARGKFICWRVRKNKGFYQWSWCTDLITTGNQRWVLLDPSGLGPDDKHTLHRLFSREIVWLHPVIANRILLRGWYTDG